MYIYMYILYYNSLCYAHICCGAFMSGSRCFGCLGFPFNGYSDFGAYIPMRLQGRGWGQEFTNQSNGLLTSFPKLAFRAAVVFRQLCVTLILAMAFQANQPADPLTNMIERCKRMVSTDAPHGLVLLRDPGPVSANDLPLDPFNANTLVRSIVDRMSNSPGPYDFPALRQVLRERRYNDLPDTL